MIIVATAVIVFLMLRASGIFISQGVSRLDASFDLPSDVNNGFVLNPYQSGNTEQNQALIIGASVSYILREIKSFTMFSVILAVLALTAHEIIIYMALKRITMPIVAGTVEIQKDNSDNNNVNNNNSEPCNYIEGLSSNPSFLSLNIDEMLASIDSTMEKSQVNLKVML
jgi:hypothetical protein